MNKSIRGRGLRCYATSLLYLVFLYETEDMNGLHGVAVEEIFYEMNPTRRKR